MEVSPCVAYCRLILENWYGIVRIEGKTKISGDLGLEMMEFRCLCDFTNVYRSRNREK